jgi:co-chaperonin GroES (HSP10)
MIKFQPLADNILIEPLEDTQTGGLIIAEGEKKTVTGKVLAAGTGRWEAFGLVASRLRVGDTVWFATYSKHEIRLDGKVFFIVPEKEILGFKRENSNLS